jgi:thioredoxin 1
MSTNIADVGDANFTTEVLRSQQPVLVDFWAEWCGPCRTLGPIVEEIADEYRDVTRVLKLNVDQNPSAVERYRVQAIPTLILFQNGEEKERLVGAARKAVIARAIDAHINHDTH